MMTPGDWFVVEVFALIVVTLLVVFFLSPESE